MKVLILIFFITINAKCFSQNLFLYRDTINNFSIGLPKAWKYQIINDASTSIKLTVSRLTNIDNERPRETFNVNVLSFPNSNIDTVYSDMLKTISTRSGYKLISEGDTTMESKKYKWLIEQHTNNYTKETMTAFIYLGYNRNLAFMITFATIASSFKEYELLFRQIGSSFRIQ